MPLASLSFVLFLVGISSVSFIAPARWRWLLFLVASYLFYWQLAPAHTVLLALITGASFIFARAIDTWREQERRARLIRTTAVVSLLLPLGVLKYSDFVLESGGRALAVLGTEVSVTPLGFLLPVGISFFTFLVVGYVIDVHREMAASERHFGRYAAFVAFFPHITAGPIGRSDLLAQFEQPPGFEYERVTSGIKLIGWGFLQKVVIADRLGVAVDNVFAAPSNYSGAATLLIVVFYAFQVYADFSGYTDIAIGSARVLGIDLDENFLRPYLSRSVGEYWRRWHLSFSNWLRDYLYMPIGAGLRSWRTKGSVVALFLTFLIAGLWHGAAWTFVVFGAAHGIMLVLELLTKRPRARLEKRFPKASLALSWLVTFTFLCWVDVLFRASSLGEAADVYRQVATIPGDAAFVFAQPAVGAFKTLFVGLGLSSTELVLALLGICLLVVIDLLQERRPMSERMKTWPIWLRWTLYYAAAVAILFYGSFHRTTTFVYYQF